ncbi:SERTA domain-containing protein 3 isoform X2 [Genypterus blacodes]|uniref:SERTA domain-containing protein 3 isoform X2 n=1 Tax=Genypterus blacodes TaxID=154954 RepID=UPI003F757ACC
MIAKGQKRKLPMDENDALHSGATWESQRQFVFSVSLSKYQRGQELPEPSLRRTVLIANTLRHISLDGDVAPAVQMEAPPPPPSCSSEFTLQEKEQEAAISSILTALDSIDGGPQAAQRAPLQSLENLSGSPENLKCLPSFASFCPSSSSSSSPFSPSDGLELEHLMEILVES